MEEASTTELGGTFLSGTMLTESINDVQRVFRRPEPAKELTDKFRWMIINVTNETQFSLKFEKEWFNVGRFWDAPSNIAAFSHSYFSGCNTIWDAAGCHGVSGTVLFYIEIPGQQKIYPITVAFSNPGVRAVKTRAEFSQDVKEVWQRMDERCTYSTELDIGIQCTRFELLSTPGNQAMVTLTQVYKGDNEFKLLDEANLSEAIGKSRHQPTTLVQPTKELKENHRWIGINIANETQFGLKYQTEWFHVGRFWDAPTNIAPFHQASYSGCSTFLGSAGYRGVSGAALFYLQIPGQLKEHPISIAFSNPGGAGSIKTRADFSYDMKEVWKRMDDQGTYNTEKVIGIQQRHTKFQLTSTPGNQAKVTLTQEMAKLPPLEIEDETGDNIIQDIEQDVQCSHTHHVELLQQLTDYAMKWRSIGIHLGFREGELDNIQGAPLLLQEAPVSWLCKMLSQWLEWGPGDSRGSTNYATLNALKAALSNAEIKVKLILQDHS